MAEYKRTPADTGSPEVQIAQLSARVIQLTGHLQTHKKDYASRRGLLAALSNRKSLMQYLLRKDRYLLQRCTEALVPSICSCFVVCKFDILAPSGSHQPAVKCWFWFCRPAYERVIKELEIRPLKVQAGRNVIIKLQEGAEPEKVHQTDASPEAE